MKKWKLIKENEYENDVNGEYFINTYACPSCNWKVRTEGEMEYRFCPMCGEDLRGEQKLYETPDSEKPDINSKALIMMIKQFDFKEEEKIIDVIERLDELMAHSEGKSWAEEKKNE